jgi:tripartite-type tricarboxylate transporter receptor subunit TctC
MVEGNMLRLFKHAVLASSLLLTTAANAAWPEKPVTVIVPFAPGGITDVVARVAAERLQAKFKQTFVIENDTGAGGLLAAQRAVRAAPDGYTLFFCPIFQITVSRFTQKLNFDPIKDLTPIAITAFSPFVITVGEKVPVNNLAEFIAYVKSKPGQLTYGSAGPGSLTHISSAVFLKNAGLDMIHVPYKGIAPAFSDILAGHIQMLSATPVEAKSYIESGKVKALAVTNSERTTQLPNVPTITETLKKSPNVMTWQGMLAPAGTPKEIVDAMAREIAVAEKDPEFRQRLTRIGVDPVTSTPEEFQKLIVAETDRWRVITRELGLKPPE